ncbi:YjaG family protein [Shewanella sp. A3A]|uniref:YjaG family protein n=1 Tax=Shewanella electrica TaxID=515560 RepID=A0ABT2FH70_9GAMM|nr:YjaG family protein [Shewanella electrica]MCH1918376.1 YjaG family protein [Shewanella ferrihydritica]MCH1925466.1 YjaG family protein [Shewanella electrica]MCS4555291.1 YjaG family protein [Shewanella electrica]
MTKPGFFKRLKALSLQQKKLFAVALCQRMQPNYQLFAEVCEFGNASVLDTLQQLLWQSLYDNKLKLNLEAQINKLEENTPEPEDFDVYGVYPALDAVVALSSYLGALESKIEDDITNISKLSSATVANYVEALIGDDFTDEAALDEAVYAHPMMQQERELQASLLELIEDNPEPSADFIKALRKEIVQDGVSNIGISLSDSAE